ncbi:MAG TPA: hypothetical protein VK912_19765 [Longimicrobiales bacterium]|nr:hypothetical protein [Longimicrobiales bacterium]
MAPGIKWLAIVVGGSVLMSAVARTVPDVPFHERRGSDELTRLARANMVALMAADRAYREHARADSLLSLLPASPGVTVQLSPALDAAERDTLSAFIAREAAEIDQPRGRAGVFLIEDTFGGHPAVRQRGGAASLEIYTGVDSAGAYCAMVGTGRIGNNGSMFIDGFQHLRRSHHTGVLGPCTFVARYGAPGARISHWLRAGGYRLAEVPGPAANIVADDAPMFWTSGDLMIRGCIAGRADLCDRIVSFEPRPERPGAATVHLQPAYRFSGTADRLLLSEAEAAFGRDRFARFWTSDADVPVAFASAFGIELGDWLREWGREYYGEQTLGPGLGAASVLLSVLAVMALAAAAAAVSIRRRI